MRLLLHIGPDRRETPALRTGLRNQRDALAKRGVLVPTDTQEDLAGRLLMAVLDPDHVDPMRFETGCVAPARQELQRDALLTEVQGEISAHRPDTLILIAEPLGTALHRATERERLRALLEEISTDIRIIAHLTDPTTMVLRHFAWQVMNGRSTPLDRDLALAAQPDWWQACVDAMPRSEPEIGCFEEIEGAPFWLDAAAFLRFWQEGFGIGSVQMERVAPGAFTADRMAEGLSRNLGLGDLPRFDAITDSGPEPSAAGLARARQMNALFRKVLASGKRVIPRALWREFLSEVQVEGPPINPAPMETCLSHLASRTSPPAPSTIPWEEADLLFGFRASQYLLAFMYRIDKATRLAKRSDPQSHHPQITPHVTAILPPKAVANLAKLQGSPLAPHDHIGNCAEAEPLPPYDPVPPRADLPGTSGRIIVACMKNEAPYILEWIAYHRAIGIDGFLIYTNDCSDGTTELLERLQEMGLIQHRRNDDWKGKSPQQHALNRALKEDILRQAEWIVHIDVDEFINVRTGNGTLDDFFAVVPDASNIAMTWRLFGHNGVTGIADDFVIAQFDTCAPKYCPKPHTAWGFKTMFRNIGAYGKLSCHRPNKLDVAWQNRVKWVNGSGQDMTAEVCQNGWRNSRKSIGYDLLQLNHYALRSADSFLVKRQRGRALHVDRSIGLNYWIRMDWSDVRDVTIQRNIPRVKAEYDRLLTDPVLCDIHNRGLAWHRTKAAELREIEEFRALYDQVRQIRLNGTERAAYALALDTDS